MSRLPFFACLACGHTENSADGASLRCLSCGHAYPIEAGIPLLVRDWSAHEAQVAEAQRTNPGWYLDEQPVEAVSPWRHHLQKRRRYVENVVQAYLLQNSLERVPRLLDLGCGDGNNLGWLARYAETAHGSDYNLVRLARARARLPQVTLFLADLLDYPAADDSFDIVFFNHVIEHIPDDAAALATVRRILRPGGLLVLGTPNEGSWWWQLAYRRAPETLATTDHVHFYTAGVIAERMRVAGLAVSEVEHLGWGPPDWYWDGRLRGYKFLDDLFEWVGRLLLPRQASSLYLIATKQR